jgi:hypothetical protein
LIHSRLFFELEVNSTTEVNNSGVVM